MTAVYIHLHSACPGGKTPTGTALLHRMNKAVALLVMSSLQLSGSSNITQRNFADLDESMVVLWTLIVSLSIFCSK